MVPSVGRESSANAPSSHTLSPPPLVSGGHGHPDARRRRPPRRRGRPSCPCRPAGSPCPHCPRQYRRHPPPAWISGHGRPAGWRATGPALRVNGFRPFRGAPGTNRGCRPSCRPPSGHRHRHSSRPPRWYRSWVRTPDAGRARPGDAGLRSPARQGRGRPLGTGCLAQASFSTPPRSGVRRRPATFGCLPHRCRPAASLAEPPAGQPTRPAFRRRALPLEPPPSHAGGGTPIFFARPVPPTPGVRQKGTP